MGAVDGVAIGAALAKAEADGLGGGGTGDGMVVGSGLAGAACATSACALADCGRVADNMKPSSAAHVRTFLRLLGKLLLSVVWGAQADLQRASAASDDKGVR